MGIESHHCWQNHLRIWFCSFTFQCEILSSILELVLECELCLVDLSPNRLEHTSESWSFLFWISSWDWPLFERIWFEHETNIFRRLLSPYLLTVSNSISTLFSSGPMRRGGCESSLALYYFADLVWDSKFSSSWRILAEVRRPVSTRFSPFTFEKMLLVVLESYNLSLPSSSFLWQLTTLAGRLSSTSFLLISQWTVLSVEPLNELDL